MNYRILKKTEVIKAGDDILRGRDGRQRWFAATCTVGKRVEQVLEQDRLDIKNGVDTIPCIKVRRWKCDEKKTKKTAGWTIDPGNPDRPEEAAMEFDAFPPDLNQTKTKTKTKTRKK